MFFVTSKWASFCYKQVEEFLLQASGRVFVTSKWARARASHFYSRIKLTCTLVLFNKIGVVDVTIVGIGLAILRGFQQAGSMDPGPEF